MSEPIRDEWIIGEGLDSASRWYVIHAREPMFVIEVADEDEAELPDNGLTWSLANGQIASNLVWMSDPLPAQTEIDRWVFRVGDVLEDYDVRVDRRLAREQAAEEEDES